MGHHVGISGGERKRLAIATELQGDPGIPLLDEPTTGGSTGMIGLMGWKVAFAVATCGPTDPFINPHQTNTGLDSNMGVLICRILFNLAAAGPTHHGRIVLASTHGPSGRMIRCFTHLLVLTEAGGRVAYHGPTAEAEAFFTKALGGKARPPELNAAEFLLDCASDLCVAVGDDGDDGGERGGANTISTGGGPHASLLVPSDKPRRVAAAFDATRPSRRVSLPATAHHARAPVCGPTSVRASFWALFNANHWRSGLEIYRTPGLTGALALNALIIGLLFGILYYQQVVSRSGTPCA